MFRLAIVLALLLIALTVLNYVFGVFVLPVKVGYHGNGDIATSIVLIVLMALVIYKIELEVKDDEERKDR